MYESSSDGGPAGSFENFKSEGDVLFKQCEYKKALESYNTALELKAGDFNCLIARSQCYIDLGDADAALADAESILEVDSKHIKGLSQKAAALYQKGDFEHALVFYHRGHKLRPEVQAFRLGIQKAQEAIDNSIGENAGLELNSSGDLSYFHKQEEKQKGKAKKGGYSKPAQKRDEKKDKRRTRTSPYDTKTCKQLLGELYPDKEYLEKILQETDNSERNTETNMAIRDIAIRCLEYLDTRTDFWQQQKPMYSRKRDKKVRDGARSSASNARKDPTNYVLSNLEKIDEYQTNGEYAKSLDLAKKTLKKLEKWSDEDIPNRHEVVANLHSSIGNAYLEMTNYDRALEHHNKDLEIAKQHDIEDAKSRALDNLGRVHARTGKFEKAIEVWEEKLPMSTSPQETTWLCHEIGRCHLELGDSEKAKEYGKKALDAAEEASDPVWQLNATVLLAQAQVKLGDLQEALNTFEKASEMAQKQGDKAARSAIEKAISDVKKKMNKEVADDDEGKEKADSSEKESSWKLLIYTADISGAGTDANVFVVVYGEKDGKMTQSEKKVLDNMENNFEQGKVDEFDVEMDIGVPYKARVGHDNSGAFAAWNLDKVELENKATKHKYTFKCGGLLLDVDDDGDDISKELPAEGGDIKDPLPVVTYKLQVHTGEKWGSGTDANVYINLKGEQGDTGKRPLAKSKNNENKFENGNVDEFELEAVSLKKLTSVTIGHDGEGGGSGWYVDKIVVTCGDGPVVEFPCNRWLDVDEDDHKIERELTPAE